MTKRNGKRRLQCYVPNDIFNKVEEYITSNEDIETPTDFVRKATLELLGLISSSNEQPNTKLLETKLSEKVEQIKLLENQLSTLNERFKDEQKANAENRKLMAADKAHINYLSKPIWQRWFQQRPALNP